MGRSWEEGGGGLEWGLEIRGGAWRLSHRLQVSESLVCLNLFKFLDTSKNMSKNDDK